MRNEAPRPISASLQQAVTESVDKMHAAALTDEQLAGEYLPLFATSVAVRARLVSDEKIQKRQNDRDIGNAIGTYFMGKFPQ